jgi:hypothetical protein
LIAALVVIAALASRAALHAHADPPPPAATPPAVQVAIVAPAALHAGDHANVIVNVELAAEGDTPVVLTPSVEGSAVEIVRGRMLRSDGVAVDAKHLRFELPVIARDEGTAILRVELSTYACTPRCRQAVVGATQVLRVSAK